jgi:predicted MPP superfamily phosphohydrolase
MDFPRLVAFLTFIATFWLVVHLYVGWRVIGPLKLSSTRRHVAWALLLAHAPLAIAGFLSMPRVTEPWADVVQTVGFLSLGLFGAFAAMVVARDLLLLGLRAVDRVAGGPMELQDPSRRAALLTGTHALIAGATATIGAVGYPAARALAEVVEVELPVPDLPADLEGFRIAQISDLHVGPTVRADDIRAVVERVNALDADMVALTGDLVDGSVERLAPHVAPLAELRSRHGTFFCTGNHEYYSGVHAWCEHLASLGLGVLLDAHQVLEHGSASILIAGITDRSAHRMVPEHDANPHRAVAGAPTTDLRVLLAHQPMSIVDAEGLDFHLQLSGHTHGGQFFPFTWLIRLAQPFNAGLHRVASTWLYVNRGTTYWGPPLRLGSPQEITLLRLVRG